MPNETSNFFTTADNSSSLVQVIIMGLESFNLLLLVPVTFSFYQGIEIQHPLYAVLFYNLIVSIVNSAISVLGCFVLPFKTYVRLLNVLNLVHLFYLCSNWSVTSVIRYVYILHDSWLHTILPSPKIKCCLAIGFSVLFALLQSSPVVAVGLQLGKL